MLRDRGVKKDLRVGEILLASISQRDSPVAVLEEMIPI